MSGAWFMLSVQAPQAGEELLLVDALRRLGARTVEREGQRFLAGFPAPGDVPAFLADARAAIRASTSIEEPWLSWRWQSHHAWAEQRRTAFTAQRIGDRILVVPLGEQVTAGPGDVVIRLTAAAAFGTGEHVTTRSCLSFLERLVEPGARVADVGAGTAVLSIAAALLGASEARAFEADPYACAVARENVLTNGVSAQVRICEVRVGPATLRSEAPFDGVVANIEAGVLTSLVPGLARALTPTGWLLVSGVLVPEREQVVGLGGEAGLRLETERVEQGWWTAVFHPAGSTRSDERGPAAVLLP